MTPDEFEHAYERLAAALDAVGEANETLFLVRLALLLADACPDPAAFAAALEAAQAGLPPADGA